MNTTPEETAMAVQMKCDYEALHRWAVSAELAGLDAEACKAFRAQLAKLAERDIPYRGGLGAALGLNHSAAQMQGLRSAALNNYNVRSNSPLGGLFN